MPDQVNATPDASANAPQIDTQGSTVPNQLRDASAGLAGPVAPAGAPAPKVPVAQPAPSPASLPITATSANKQTHNFIGRALGGLLDAVAGPGTPTYTTTADGKLIANAAPPRSTAQKMEAIASHMLTGLSAPSPQEPSGIATLLGGVGAGFGAVRKQMSEADKAAQGKAREDFETTQQSKLRQMEIGKQNALEFSTYMANRRTLNDMNPIYQEGNQFLKTIQASPDLASHIHEMTDQELQQKMTDPTFVHTHIVKALGWQPDADPATGDTIRDSSGQLTSHMTFAVMDGTKDGKIIVSPEWAADFAKYGKMAGIPNVSGIKAGDTYEWGQLLPLHNKIDEQKKFVTEGELSREYAWQTDAKGKKTPISINPRLPIGDSERIKQLDYVPAKLLDEQATVDLKEAQAANQREQAKNQNLFGPNAVDPLAAANYKAPDNLMAQKPEDLRQYLTQNKQPVPANFETLYSVGHYDNDPAKYFSANPRKGSGLMSRDAAMNYIRRYVNPNYQDTNYDAVKKMKVEFADLSPNKPGGNLLAFNVATGHLGQLWVAAEALHNNDVQALNRIANTIGAQVGTSPTATFNSVKTALTEEIGKNLKGSSADIPLIESIQKTLNTDMAPTQLAHSLQAYAHVMLKKAKETGLAYHAFTGEWPPNTVSDDARAVYKDLGIDSSDVLTGAQIRGSQPPAQGSQGGPAQGQTQNAPPPTSHVFDSTAWQKTHPGQDVNAAIAYAKSQGYEVKQ